MQGSEEKSITEHRKKRSQSEKIGWFKYKDQQILKILSDLKDVKLGMREMRKGLAHLYDFSKPFIQTAACKSDVDVQILDLLFENQPEGLLPKDIAARLQQFKIDRFQVLRRLKAMNRRLESEIGRDVAEKRGHHWALTSFAVGVWGETEEEVKAGW